MKFLANVDPVDFKRATRGLDPETTLVVVVSKVGGATHRHTPPRAATAPVGAADVDPPSVPKSSHVSATVAHGHARLQLNA